MCCSQKVARRKKQDREFMLFNQKWCINLSFHDIVVDFMSNCSWYTSAEFLQYDTLQCWCISRAVATGCIIETPKEIFPCYQVFFQSVFITLESFFVSANIVLKSFSNTQQRELFICLSKHSYTCKFRAENYLYNCVSGVLYVKIEIAKNTLAKSLQRRALEYSCSDKFCIMMYKGIPRN